MPELPEVEFARRQWERWLDGRTVLAARGEPTRIFRGSDPKRLSGLRGRLERAERKGKYLLLTFEGGFGLLSHLGMTGKYVRRPEGHVEPYSRARFVLDSGEVIHYRDPRLFGRMEPVSASELWQLPVIRELGVDPVNEQLTWQRLKDAVGDSKQDLKVALMDQSRVAGLGNIHAAEALFRAGLHPARKPRSLSDDEWKALNRGIHASLDFALKQADEDEIDYVEEPGSDNPFKVYGWGGAVCRRCREGIIDSFVQGGRTTYFCPRCQPRRGRRERKVKR